jgi:hypothetical protein
MVQYLVPLRYTHYQVQDSVHYRSLREQLYSNARECVMQAHTNDEL